MERAYRVLLADDEPIILESLKMAIPWEQYGMKVAGEARNGQEALEAAAVIKPDIIVSDIRMPVIDGIQFMRELKKGRMDQEPLFIVISGYGEFEYAREALRSGAFDYILNRLIMKSWRRLLPRRSWSWMFAGIESWRRSSCNIHFSG